MSFEMSLETFKFAWAVIVTLLSVGVTFVTYWAHSKFAQKENLAELSNKVDRMVPRTEMNGATVAIRELIESQGTRLTRIETELKHMPTDRDFDGLKSELSGVSQRMAKLEGQAERNNHLLAAIHDHLLNDKG